jgi:hypothetical protein
MDEAAFLARFRRPAGQPPRAHPGPFPPPVGFAGGWPAFAETLAGVGGTMLTPTPDWRTAVQSAIQLDPGPVRAAAAAQPLLAGLGGWDAAGDPAEPHVWAGTGLAVLLAEMAVVENAALLLSARVLPERALGFLAERVLVLVPATALVPDFTTAHARLAADGRGRGEDLLWMSGPSKTADIEQCLVIGAHGSRALTVAVMT